MQLTHYICDLMVWRFIQLVNIILFKEGPMGGGGMGWEKG